MKGSVPSKWLSYTQDRVRVRVRVRVVVRHSGHSANPNMGPAQPMSRFVVARRWRVGVSAPVGLGVAWRGTPIVAHQLWPVELHRQICRIIPIYGHMPEV